MSKHEITHNTPVIVEYIVYVIRYPENIFQYQNVRHYYRTNLSLIVSYHTNIPGSKILIVSLYFYNVFINNINILIIICVPKSRHPNLSQNLQVDFFF